MQHNAHENTQYLIPLEQFSKALSDYPNLQSMHKGAHNVQQHASQNK